MSCEFGEEDVSLAGAVAGQTHFERSDARLFSCRVGDDSHPGDVVANRGGDLCGACFICAFQVPCCHLRDLVFAAMLDLDVVVWHETLALCSSQYLLHVLEQGCAAAR